MNPLSLWRQARARCCVLCHDSADAVSDGLCLPCRHDLTGLHTHAHTRCPQCSRAQASGAVCGACQKHPPPFARLWASCRYEAPVSSLIYAFKHQGDLGLAAPLAALMLANPPPWLAECGTDWQLLAMPLSRERRLQRGFNQTEILAEHLAASLQLPTLPRHSVQRAHRPPQSTLAAAERRRNVKNSFQLCTDVCARNVLLIDDVATTGATLEELARSLKKSGAAQVRAWTLAHAEMKK